MATARAGLGADDPGVRATALGALERLGVLDTTTLVAALGDDDAVVRRRAAELAATHPDVPLAGPLADPEPSVVEMAAWACGERERVDDADLDTVIGLAGDAPDALVREAAVAALGAIGDDRGLDAILTATADKPAIRRRAVLALAPFVAPDHERAGEVATALERALTDRDWQVRQAAEDITAD
ncbi:MAG: HEAT repeat domain-containing protein [Ilumatobacteraceae bacterium]